MNKSAIGSLRALATPPEDRASIDAWAIAAGGGEKSSGRRQTQAVAVLDLN
jgi:hypothetical protein